MIIPLVTVDMIGVENTFALNHSLSSVSDNIIFQ